MHTKENNKADMQPYIPKSVTACMITHHIICTCFSSFEDT